MAELTHKERLQPSLLDRLTDEEPDKEQEARTQRVLSPARLRECVLRDLQWLFNTTNLASVKPEIEDYPHVAESVVNYGLPDFTGQTASTVDIPALERRLRNAIWQFEPRLVRNSVRVFVDEKAIAYNVLTFTIEAVLWAQPLPLRLFLRTEVDLETGGVEVAEVRE